MRRPRVRCICGRTRIVESGDWCLRPRWLQAIARFLSIEAQHWVMQTRQFANLRRRIARASVHSNQPLATTNSLAGNER